MKRPDLRHYVRKLACGATRFRPEKPTLDLGIGERKKLLEPVEIGHCHVWKPRLGKAPDEKIELFRSTVPCTPLRAPAPHFDILVHAQKVARLAGILPERV